MLSNNDLLSYGGFRPLALDSTNIVWQDDCRHLRAPFFARPLIRGERWLSTLFERHDLSGLLDVFDHAARQQLGWTSGSALHAAVS